MLPYRTLLAGIARATRSRSSAALGCASDLVDITAMVDGYFGSEDDRRGRAAGRRRRRARCGAATSRRGCGWPSCTTDPSPGAGSSSGPATRPNRSSATRPLFGDSACAFNPIGDLYKSQVRQLAVALGVPDAIVRKAPSADLWPGQTDEHEGGFSYPVLDRLLFWRIDKRRSIDEMVALGFDAAMVERVDRMVAGAEFKRQVPPIAKLGPRTAGVDYLYPRRRPGSSRG